MRRFKYIEPKDPDGGDWSHIEIVVTEQDIVNDFWPYWSAAMRRKGKIPSLSDCIDDFVVIHWASEIKEE